MIEAARIARNVDRLRECHPIFRARLEAIIVGLESDGERPRIQDAWRDPQEQIRKFLSGHSKLRWGFHNATSPDGVKEALAVDLLDDDDATDDGTVNLSRGVVYVFKLAQIAERFRCSTGVDWGFPVRMKTAMWKAIEARDYTWPVKEISWDPMHVEIADVSVADAKRGVRPVWRPSTTVSGPVSG